MANMKSNMLSTKHQYVRSMHAFSMIMTLHIDVCSFKLVMKKIIMTLLLFLLDGDLAKSCKLKERDYLVGLLA